MRNFGYLAPEAARQAAGGQFGQTHQVYEPQSIWPVQNEGMPLAMDDEVLQDDTLPIDGLEAHGFGPEKMGGVTITRIPSVTARRAISRASSRSQVPSSMPGRIWA